MKHFITSIVFIFCALSTPLLAASNVNFDLLKATPIGSWQVREDIETNHKGKQTGTTVRTSMLSTEMRNAEKHYWIEVAIDSFKINKKGNRKPKGKQTVIKSLMPASLFSKDPANVLGNIRAFGTEMIIQTGSEDPMRMNNSGGFMGGLMKSMNLEINYDFNDAGAETVTVKAGNFNTNKIQGSGSTDAKVMFKKIKVESDNTSWMSTEVPFGIVKNEGTSIINGKQSTYTSELIDFGLSGATSLITKEPQDMPEMPAGMEGLFGK